MNKLVLFFYLLPILGLTLLAQTKEIPQRSDSIVAIVNDEIITYGDLTRFLKVPLQEIEKSTAPRRQKELQKQQIMKLALRQMVDRKLTLQEAKKYNIQISEETIKEQIEKELKDRGEKLFDEGEVDLKELVKSRLSMQELFQQKAGYSQETKQRAAVDTYISPMEIKQYYKKNIKEFTKESKIKTRIITLFYSKNGGQTQTLEKAEAIVKQLREGADFSEMAKLHSDDPYAKEGGSWPRIEQEGKMTWTFFGKGEALYKEVEDIAFSMQQGEISDPIPLEEEPYCQIIKIEEMQVGGVIDFQEAQESIRQKLRYEKVIDSLSRMRNRLREKSFIWPADLFED